MASIDCAKYTSGQVGGLKVHFDQDKRLECNHENPHIDKNKTHLNSFHDTPGYSDMLRRQRERVANVDELHPPERIRKDRITAVMMEIPVPESISNKGLTEKFLQDIYAMVGEMIGKENMCGMTIHRDEIHDYIDHGGKVRTSLEHGHAMVVPYARWTAKETVHDADGKPCRDDQGKILKQDVAREGVNAKHFLTRNFLKKLQDKTQEMVLERYGISYQTSQEPMHMTVEELKQESARAAEIIDRAEEHAQGILDQVKELDEISAKIALEGPETIKAENYTIEAKKSILGQIREPERVGVFIEDMTQSQITALVQRVNVDERIENSLERTRNESQNILATAKEEAEKIKAEATAERDKTIAEAEAIVRERFSIINAAKTWAEDVRRKYKEMSDKVKQLLGIKAKLEAEVSDLQQQKEGLGAVRAEVQELQRAKDILTGAVENEITQSRFHEPTGGFNSPDSEEKWHRLDRGELLALYKDGTIRTVTRNPQGGMDYKTLDNSSAGLCRIGWFKEEEKVSVPRNLLKELLEKRDKTQPISRNLENMIDQQTTANRVIGKVKSGRGGRG